jgi:opacity protein-like surface antigen
MKKFVVYFFAVLLVLATAQNANAQRWFKTSSLEFGLIGGASHYSGELTNEQFFESRGLKPSVGLITRYTPHDVFTLRLSAQWGGLEGNDAWYQDGTETNPRNLSFRSVLWDFTGAAEINLRTLDMRQSSGLIPYIFGGVSVFRFNPEALFEYDPNSPHLTRPGSAYADLQDRDGEWVELQPLATEGQETTEFNERRRYNLTQVAVPLGAGIKAKLSNKWTLGVEYGARITFTDYIDDVSTTYVDPSRLQSQYGAMSAAMADRSPILHDELVSDANDDRNNVRGNPDNNDLYGIIGVTLTYRIYGNRPRCPSF